jgi:hypothetical protein
MESGVAFYQKFESMETERMNNSNFLYIQVINS